MKTNNSIQASFVTMMTILSLVMTGTLKGQNISKQKLKLGLNAETYLSGNTHGTYYSIGPCLSSEKFSVSLAPCFQKRQKEMNGAKLFTSYVVSRGNNPNYQEDVLELSVFSSLQYLHQAGLSYNASRFETTIQEDNQFNVSNIRMSTVDASIGFQLNVNFNKIKIRNYIGATVFYHINYNEGLYNERCAPALTLGTAIVIPKFK